MSDGGVYVWKDDHRHIVLGAVLGIGLLFIIGRLALLPWRLFLCLVVMFPLFLWLLFLWFIWRE